MLFWLKESIQTSLSDFKKCFFKTKSFLICENLRERILKAGMAIGLRANFHAEELNYLGGAEMGAEIGVSGTERGTKNKGFDRDIKGILKNLQQTKWKISINGTELRQVRCPTSRRYRRMRLRWWQRSFLSPFFCLPRRSFCVWSLRLLVRWLTKVVFLSCNEQDYRDYVLRLFLSEERQRQFNSWLGLSG